MPTVLGSTISTLTPLQLTAGSSLLQNQGLRINPSVPATISLYVSLPLIDTYLSMYTAAAAGTGGLSTGTVQTLANIASPTCAALADGIPQFYLNLGTFNILVGYPYPTPGLTGIISKKASLYLGSGDLSKFAQIFSACIAYQQLANQFIISACNADDYLCDTFSNNDDSITGDITKINLATPAFGQDLANLGQLWDLNNLENLGSPLALVQRIIGVVGTIPIISLTFVAYGVPTDVAVNLDDPNISVTDAVQKAMYEAMTNITGDNLAQILQILGVTTIGIETMADLLNPYKLFPNSFQSMTVPTVDGPRPIYTNSQGDVNTTLVQQLPPYILSSTV